MPATLSGSVKALVKPEQYEKTFSSMSVTPPGIMTPVRPESTWHAPGVDAQTLAGIVTLVILCRH